MWPIRKRRFNLRVFQIWVMGYVCRTYVRPYAGGQGTETGQNKMLRSLEEPYEMYMAHLGVGKKRMKRMLDGAQVVRGSKKDGVSLGVFLVHVVVSSAELTDLKPKGFGKFSVNPASRSLFLRVLAGCSGMNRRKEKPSETNWFPTV